MIDKKLPNIVKQGSVDQVREMDSVCELVVAYLIAYTFKRHSNQIQEEFEPCLSSNQVLTIIQSLLNGALLNITTDDTFSIDINTLLAIISSSKVPTSSKAPQGNEKQASELPSSSLVPQNSETTSSEKSNLMRNLVDSFAKRKFREDKTSNKENLSPEKYQLDSKASTITQDEQKLTPRGLL